MFTTLVRLGTIDRARQCLKTLFEAYGVDSTHGIEHADAVLAHATKAVEDYHLTFSQKTAVMLAALLHDADDEKYFKGTHNARDIVKGVECDEGTVELVCEMIGLVSTRKNKNSNVSEEEEWKLIPRWCDRLEAMGHIGIERCLEYAKRIGNPMRTPSTPVCRTRAEVDAVATPERFAAYNGESASAIDHFYDKLLHLRRGVTSTQSSYLKEESERRHQILVDFVLLYSAPPEVTTFNVTYKRHTNFAVERIE